MDEPAVDEIIGALPVPHWITAEKEDKAKAAEPSSKSGKKRTEREKTPEKAAAPVSEPEPEVAPSRKELEKRTVVQVRSKRPGRERTPLEGDALALPRRARNLASRFLEAQASDAQPERALKGCWAVPRQCPVVSLRSCAKLTAAHSLRQR